MRRGLLLGVESECSAVAVVGARQASRLQQLPNSHRLKIRIHKPDGSVVVPARY